MSTIKVTGGMVDQFLVVSGAGNQVNVFGGGVVSDTTVEAQGYLFVSAGGNAIGSVISNGGTMYAQYTSVSGTVISSGGTLDVFDATASGTVVSNGGLLVPFDGGSVHGTTVDNGGTLELGGDATASGTSVQTGGLEVIPALDAEANGTVSGVAGSGGTVSVTAHGYLYAETVENGGTLIVDSGYIGQVTVSSGGSLSGSFLAAGGSGTIDLLPGAVVSNLTLGSGVTLSVFDASAVGTVVSSGGLLAPYDGGGVTNTTVSSGGELELSGDANATGTMVQTGGLEVIPALDEESNGTVSGVLGSGGTVSVTAHGYVYNETVQNGGTLIVNSGYIGQITVSSGGVLSGSFLPDFGGGTITLLSGGSTSGLTIGSGVTLIVQSGASDSGSTVLSGGAIVDSGYVTRETVSSGGQVTVTAGAFGYNDQVQAGGTETVQTGGKDFLIEGVVPKQTTADTTAVSPFASVTVIDTYSTDRHGGTEDVVVEQTGPGTLSGLGVEHAGGIYDINGTPAQVTAALDAAVFQPAVGVPGSTAKTTFALFDFGTFSVSGTPVPASPVADGGTVTISSVTPPKLIPHVPPYGGQIFGTPEGDQILAQGWNNVIDGLGGNDVIDAGQGNATVYTNDGNSQVTLHGYGNTVIGGDGDQSVAGSQGNTRVTLGTGADIVSLVGFGNYIRTARLNHGTIDAGLGNAQVTLDGGFGVITADGYGNSISAGLAGDATVDGAGDVTYGFTIDAGAGNENVNVAGGSASVTAGGWGDHFALGDGVFDLGGFVGTAAIDLDWTAGHSTTDSLHLRGTAGDHVTQTGNGFVVTGANGANVATINTPGGAFVESSDNAGGLYFTFANGPVHTGPIPPVLPPVNAPVIPRVPTVTIVPQANPQVEIIKTYYGSFDAPQSNLNYEVEGGPGRNEVTLGNGSNTVSLSGYTDQVTVGSGQNVINVGEGTSTITVASGGEGTISTQGYYNFIDITGTAGGVYQITAGAGDDTVELGTAAATVNLAGYTNTVTGGYGPADINLTGQGGGDTFQITAVGSKGGMDIANFGGAAAGNMLDLSQILPGVTSATPNLMNYVQVFSDQGTNSYVLVDPSGGGALRQVAYLQGTGGADLSTMLANHQIKL